MYYALPMRTFFAYHIRYNTQHGDSEWVWRVFENGVEHLAKHLDIRVPLRDASTVESGVVKWNVYCEGVMRMVDGTAVITSGE
jgi:hypothetical protein